MLILQRKQGQSLQIGDDVVITIQEISGGKVRLSVDAPRDISILRSEVLEARKENYSALQTDESPIELINLLKKEINISQG